MDSPSKHKRIWSFNQKCQIKFKNQVILALKPQKLKSIDKLSDDSNQSQTQSPLKNQQSNHFFSSAGGSTRSQAIRNFRLNRKKIVFQDSLAAKTPRVKQISIDSTQEAFTQSCKSGRTYLDALKYSTYDGQVFNKDKINQQMLKQPYNNQIYNESETTDQFIERIKEKFVQVNPKMNKNIQNIDVSKHFFQTQEQIKKIIDEQKQKEILQVSSALIKEPKKSSYGSGSNLKKLSLQVIPTSNQLKNKINLDQVISPKEAIAMNKRYQHSLKSVGVNRLPIPDLVLQEPEVDLGKKNST